MHAYLQTYIHTYVRTYMHIYIIIHIYSAALMCPRRQTQLQGEQADLEAEKMRLAAKLEQAGLAAPTAAAAAAAMLRLRTGPWR